MKHFQSTFRAVLEQFRDISEQFHWSLMIDAMIVVGFTMGVFHWRFSRASFRSFFILFLIVVVLMFSFGCWESRTWRYFYDFHDRIDVRIISVSKKKWNLAATTGFQGWWTAPGPLPVHHTASGKRAGARKSAN